MSIISKVTHYFQIITHNLFESRDFILQMFPQNVYVAPVPAG